MIEDKRVIAVIPARGGSKGLPRKNLLMLFGKPLLGWPVETAQKSMCVDRIIVSTEDPEIAEVARKVGAEVPFLRPAELASDDASSVSVALHALGFLAERNENYDYLILLEPTSPLTESDDIDKAIEILHREREHADAIVGVSRVQSTHPDFDVRLDTLGLIRPYAVKEFQDIKRRQEIEVLYFLDGSLYASAVDALVANRTFYHSRTLGYVVPHWKSFEVDDYVDFICVEALMSRRDEITSLVNGNEQ